MSGLLTSDDATLIDLSIGLEDGPPSEPMPPSIDAFDHEAGAERLAENLRELGHDVDAEDFPAGMGLAWEDLEVIPHAGTHLDAPWHYGPEVDGEPAKTIEEIPLEWCRGNAVVLDFREKDAGEEIDVADLETALDDLNHDLSPSEIVLIQTGADELWGTPEYLTQFPGMSAEGTKFLVDQGVTVIGTDAYGFDKPFTEMGRRYVESGDESELWPAHFAGREVEYCQIEKMANLDELPRKTDVPIVAFPIKIENGSAGWVRPVAFVEDGADGEREADSDVTESGGETA
ncbi:cyclase family protein [Haloterrigena turkmenica DSM 5511]|uniref:Cyclase family protein n=1 Tax=Haloterrigena turkmenica (strain ATCC 51198 / DSM 5511 / JCM 9101 / NCIMB 13204 / VKM B-1734 / 4k) TaxID=543526 RepID=D2RQE4_HALTV|nr:cyclase family protein [Haloterrigena turkmenica]ADB62321.1 cyclase family protein [Haloterrigena turkmenica DSM 5511]